MNRLARPLVSIPIGFLVVVMLAVPQLGRAQAKWRLEPGDSVSPLRGADLAGKPITFDFAAQDRPTVVYSIAPFSKYVTANEARFASLVKQARSRFSFVVLIPEHDPRVATYIKDIRDGWGDVKVVVITDVSRALYRGMFLGAYPTTFVISPGSKVLRVFMGAYDDQSLSARPNDIEAYFDIRLPTGRGEVVR